MKSRFAPRSVIAHGKCPWALAVCDVFSFLQPKKLVGSANTLLNNDWIADKVHELLQYAEENGDILLTNPFHVVGMGNGACIASSFCQRWGNNKAYKKSLQSLISINGFLYPDSQLSAILHSASQVFESTPHNRPDIPVSYWSRFAFSEDYLKRVNPNLALNIYTAVSNPITNDGRSRLMRGCLQHRDLRGGLSPDYVPNNDPLNPERISSVQVPIILLQSTDDMLIHAANVDPFLAGRTTKHLWSHQLNILSDKMIQQASDPTGGWVGKRSYGKDDYHAFSILGKSGLQMLLDTVKNPRGAFVMWVRSGHAIFQENKAAILDLLDALAKPDEDYVGLEKHVDKSQISNNRNNSNNGNMQPSQSTRSYQDFQKSFLDEARSTKKEHRESTHKIEVLFNLKTPIFI